MTATVQGLLDAFAQAHPRRATGGIYAMAGFVFQAEVAIGKAVECLLGRADFGQAGAVFVEALSDVAVHGRDGALILLQVKRTLTAAALDSAAAEIAAIEAVDAAQAAPMLPCYSVVCQHHDIDLDWSGLPKASSHAVLVHGLRKASRLLAPQQLPNPRWQALAALWDRHSDPFGFLRFALDRVLHRQVSTSDAATCWEDIAERFRHGQVSSGKWGQGLRTVDIAIHAQPARRLEVGKRVTWERWRAGQYMARPKLAGEAMRHALALREQAVHSPSPEVAVFWLAGRSGAGKSVLLLDAVCELVQRGHSVLWLKPEEVETALTHIANGDGRDTPDFLAVDDIFDPDARDRLDIGRISILVDEQGARAWPVLLTCGPSEFADDFEQYSRFQGFKLQVQELPLLDRAEATQFVDWARDRTGAAGQYWAADPWSGQALMQSAKGQGLFVSVATELAQGDMRQFGQRFATRLKQHGEPFAGRIRLCLAVNRMYLRAPAAWLDAEARMHLEDINRDGDFSLESVEAGQDWLRLTHPHLSDAIYAHLLPANLPRLYAEDLGEAFQRALSGVHGLLAQRLLQTFSMSSGLASAQRMAAVDDRRLAERCVQAWRAHPPGGDVRLQAGMRVSLGCWPAARACLNSSVDALIADALQDMDAAEAQYPGLAWWPGWWMRLWDQHPAHPALLDWAVARLAASATSPEGVWSRVWEAVLPHAQGQHRIALEAAARQWLVTQGRRADWHFVWKALHAEALPDRQTLVDLLVHALPHEDGAHWAHVWQEALSSPPVSFGLTALLALGCEWLDGREDIYQWKYVWGALLAHARQLPEGWDLAKLIQLGCEWLAVREDKEHWVFVWQALLANDQHLPEGWDLAKLIQLGCEWLAVRENEDHWAFVWQALLANEQHLPEGWDLAGLVRLGRERLGGREGKDEWAFVWRELLAKATCLADGWDLARLVRLGCEWLGGREGMDQWTYVWQALLANGHCLPKRWDLARLVRLGCEWLDGRGDKDQWAFVWRALLANAKRLPEGWDQARLVRLGCEWLEGRESQDSWSYVWGLLLDHEAEWADELRMAEMVTLGETWLGKHLYTDSAPVVMSRLLRLTERVPFRARQRVAPLVGHWAAHCEHYSVGAAGRVLEDMADVGFARVPQVEASGIAWCQANAEHPAWIIVVVKFLCFTSGDAQWDRLASDMAGLVISHPNLVVRMLDEAERLMRQASRHARSPAFSELLGALARRAQAPQWAEARAWLEQKTCLEAVICIGPKSMTLCKLPNGLYAAVNGIKKGSHLRPDEICLVRLDDLAPEVGLVHVSLVNQKVGQG